jgi:osmoprotectant transport system substrate-binding protein
MEGVAEMKNKSPRLMGVVSVLLLAAVLLSACAGAAGEKRVVVGSKDFAEQYIIAEMYAQVLEDAGFKVERKLGLAGTPVAQAALVSKEIDLYPEYTGTGLLTVLKESVRSDPREVYEIVSKGYLEQFSLVWLDAAPMNNTQALAVRRSDYEAGLQSISDMAAQASNLVMVGPAEFPEREDGLPGIKANYGDFELKDYKAVDKGLRYLAIKDGQADVVVAFGTDGEIAAFDLVVLKDDKGMFPPYQVAPVIRKEILDQYPEIAGKLNAISGKLSDTTMQALNFEVTGNGREAADVANEWLKVNGFLK